MEHLPQDRAMPMHADTQGQGFPSPPPHHGQPIHGQFQHQQHQRPQFSPLYLTGTYVGYLVKPTPGMDGKPTWKLVQSQRMIESSRELAEMVKKDKSKVNEVYHSKHINVARKQEIDKILHCFNQQQREPGTEWVKAAILLTQKSPVSGLASVMAAKVTTSMKVIIKKVLSTKTNHARRETINLPLPVPIPALQVHQAHAGQAFHGQHPMHSMPNQSIPRQEPNIHQQIPVRSQQQGLFGEQRQGPANHIHQAMPEVVDFGTVEQAIETDSEESEFSEEEEEEEEEDRRKKNKSKKKENKKDKRQESRSPEIIIPALRQHNRRRESMYSSRPTSRGYDSETYTPYDSPRTSISGSPYGSDARRRSAQYKKYESKHHARRDSAGLRHDASDMHSNDGWEIIDRRRHAHGRHGGSSGSGAGVGLGVGLAAGGNTRSIEEWQDRTITYPRRISDRHHNHNHHHHHHHHEELLHDFERLELSELQAKEDKARLLEQQIQTNQRLHQLESIVAGNAGARPTVIERVYTEPASFGYSSSLRGRSGRYTGGAFH